MFDQHATPRWGRIALLWGGAFVVVLIVLYALGTFGFLFDTQVNNKLVQPAVRSRLDNDADYRRGIETQAKGLVAAYQQAIARLPQDTKSLADWQKANPGPNWTLVQQEEYANLQAQVQGDQNSITKNATDYNALVSNPDNGGLFTFDPNLPPSLDPTIPTAVP